MKSVKEIVKSALTMFRGKLLTSTITDGDTTHALSIDGAYDLWKQVTNNSGSTYCKMPDGTLIQWGTAANMQSGNTITFPIHFINKNYRVSITSQYNTASTIRSIYGVANSDKYNDGFTLYVWDTTKGGISTQNNVVVEWIAIGRWK